MRGRALNHGFAKGGFTLFLPLAVLAAGLGQAQAGPCAAEIDSLQAAVDARISQVAGSGRTAPESAAATRHREPTPDSIAQAEQGLGEGTDSRQALAALARARQADAAGDGASCRKSLDEVQAALGR
jgi:hypothetical protein